MPEEIALIVGAGKGLSASLARLFHSEGMKVILAARNTEKLKTIALVKCDIEGYEYKFGVTMSWEPRTGTSSWKLYFFDVQVEEDKTLYDYINEKSRKSCIIKVKLSEYAVTKKLLNDLEQNIFSITSSGKIRLVRSRLDDYFQRQIDD